MKLGHKVRLMPARDVKAYLKRNKNDAADAAAICEAVGVRRCALCGSRRLSSRGD
jgi:transposase